MIKYLETSQGKLPVRISYYALKKFQEETGTSFLKGGNTGLSDLSFGDMELLLFYSLEKGYKFEGTPMPYTKDQMEDLMDEVFFDFMKLIPEFFKSITKGQEGHALKPANPVPGKEVNPM